MTNKTTITVVIGFKDWGLDRLEFAVRSHLECSIADHVEVIISDYGSVDANAVRALASELGVKVVRTETDGVWSRARSLNRGILAASSPYVVTTDADIIFSPQTLELVVRELDRRPNALCLVQCRDLGPEHVEVINRGFDWDFYKSSSKLRPRWGMGGLAAFSKTAFSRVRGFDERMEIYGGEDNDFGKRMKAHGSPLHWIEDDEARIYHVWHEPSRKAQSIDDAAYNASMVNRDIFLNDDTIVRNLDGVGGAVRQTSPYVSVCIATYNRAEMLRECLESVLNQTFQDFEVVLVDDGSEDDTESVVRQMNDDRIRYFKKANSGVSATRNLATRMARGHFIVIHDDDDIMLHDRLENHLNALRAGDNGTHGGWIDFNSETGELAENTGKAFSYEALLFNGKVLCHAGVMIDTQFLRRYPYDEERKSGVDFDLFARMAAGGLKMRHMESFAILRRLHTTNLTFVDSATQKQSANSIIRILKSRMPNSRERTMRDVSKKSVPIGLEPPDLRPYKKYLGQVCFARVPVVGPISVANITEAAALASNGFDLPLEDVPNGSFLTEIFLVFNKSIEIEQYEQLSLPCSKSLEFLSEADAKAIGLASEASIAPRAGKVRYQIGPYPTLQSACAGAAELKEQNISIRYIQKIDNQLCLVTGLFPDDGIEKYTLKLQRLTSNNAQVIGQASQANEI